MTRGNTQPMQSEIRAADRKITGRSTLDHYVILVRDLEASGRNYERLGFRVLPRMEHIEIGSANRVVQFQRTYLELIGEIDNAAPLVRENLAERLECGEGLCIVSLDSQSLEADHARVEAMGLEPAPIINARRKIRMPDGTIDETCSRCFYVWRPKRRYLSLFFSQHHKPDTIWVPEYQDHPNTAVETTGITYVSDDPAQDRDYFTSLYGCLPETEEPGLIRFRGAGGDFVEIYSRSRLADRYPSQVAGLCDKLAGYPAGIQVRVRDSQKLQSMLEKNEVGFTAINSKVLVGPGEAHGAVIEFVVEQD